LECGGLTPPLSCKGGVKPLHSKGFAATYEAELLRRALDAYSLQVQKYRNRIGCDMAIPENESVGSVLVCGGSVAGVQAALDLASGGFKVYLLESTAAIGGKMARIESIVPSGDCPMCILTPRMVECARNRNIEIITLSDIQSISGKPGHFKVKIRQNPRYVDLKMCDACGDCSTACPVYLPEEAGSGQEARKAISRVFPQAIPNVFGIVKASGQTACTVGCPAGVNVQGFVALVREGKLAEAYELILKRCPLPASSGRICRHSCEEKCRRIEIDEAVSIRDLERFVADSIQSDPELYPVSTPSPNKQGGRVAVVGGGPAGLTAANDLALMGYEVTLFESQDKLGGMLRYGIPAFRLPKDVLQKEIQSILKLGINVQTNTRIANPKNLLVTGIPSNGEGTPSEPFHAVFLATGAWGPRKLGIPGENGRGVWQAVNFLYAVNSGAFPPIGPNVTILGGTDLALDAARCALRLPGVKSVDLACLESWVEMPADPDVIDEACKEGIIVHNGLGATRFEMAGNRVMSVRFRACTSVYDENKRFDPLFDDAIVSSLPTDTVIVATGRLSDVSGFGLEMRPGSRILADSRTLAAGFPGIFAGGDVVLGPASMAEAIAQGHKAAEGIDAYLRGSSHLRSTEPVTSPAPSMFRPNSTNIASNPNPGAPFQERVKIRPAESAGRLQFMNEIRLGYSKEQARIEAGRCLSCGLCSECLQCVKACTAGAIRHDQQPTEIELEVGSIIYAPGVTESDPCGPGIYETGKLQDPEDIGESSLRGSAAAAGAMRQLTSVRGTQTQRREYPWERDVSDEAPRIGVFVCHCGHNISSVVDVESVVRKASKMLNVIHAEAADYTCSDLNQRRIKEMIRKYRLNRLVIASCSSRTHEILFQETLRESGLNRYLLAMTNIRDECSWVHRDDPSAATAKAIDLVSMAVAQARLLKAFPLTELPVTPSALIIGGGLAGMTAAKNIADQGYQVHLVEKSSALGGMLSIRRMTLENPGIQEYLNGLVESIQSHPKIHVYVNAELSGISGQAGDFTSILAVDGREVSVDHAVVIVATGGSERDTEQHLHGKNQNVITQSQLESMLANDAPPAGLENNRKPTVVMIQCVESRNSQHPYCSRICCSEAVKNALEIKRRYPNSEVVVLGGGMLTYGPQEAFYQKALEKRVRFIAYPEGMPPVVTEDAGLLKVSVRDAALNRDLAIHPDLLVLSTGIAPAADNEKIAQKLRSNLTAEGFFTQAHPKLRPVDLINEGQFLCGWAQSPQFLEETVLQAHATASRAAAILSKTKLEILGRIALVNPDGCVACTTCVKVCPYGAPRINEVRKSEIQGTKCIGCGSCAAACPSRTITLQQLEGIAMEAMLDELLLGGGSR
jgi:heterodisulfide reductase subunit A-like polyferredoxin